MAEETAAAQEGAGKVAVPVAAAVLEDRRLVGPEEGWAVAARVAAVKVRAARAAWAATGLAGRKNRR